MTGPVRAVNTVADLVLRSELTLSAAPDLAQPSEESRSAPELTPPEAVVRDERDPYIVTELELRALWGDR